MSTSPRPEKRLLRICALALAAAAIASALPRSAAGDELVLRPNIVLKDKHVDSFDEDGVRLGAAARPIGWDQVVRATLSTDQARFDRLRQHLSEPLHGIRKGLADGNYASLLQPAEALFPTFANRRSTAAYMVAQALMWAQLANHHPEDAIEPYFVVLILRQTVKDLESIPGPRRVQYDTRTGLCPELALVGFDRDRASSALPKARARLRALGTESAPELRLYLAALALAANDAAGAESELSQIGAPSRPAVEMADALRAQAMLVRGKTAEGLARLEELRNASLAPQRALIDYLSGQARLASGTGNPLDGVLDLLNVAASHSDDQPTIAATALYAAQKALVGQHDTTAARAVQIELVRAFPESDQCAQLKSELGPDSTVVKAAAELDAAEAKAAAADASEGNDAGPDRARPKEKPGRRRPGRSNAKGKPR
jgi:hypothetical protein